MRRANNTIPREEYNILLADAMIRARKMISALMDEEAGKMRKADNQQRYEKAERYDFNARALMRLYNESFNIETKLRKWNAGEVNEQEPAGSHSTQGRR